MVYIALMLKDCILDFSLKSKFGLGVSWLESLALPESEDRRVDSAFKEKRRGESSDHGRGDAAHNVGTGPGAPHDG